MEPAYLLLCAVFIFMVIELQKDSNQKQAFWRKIFVICNIKYSTPRSGGQFNQGVLEITVKISSTFYIADIIHLGNQ